MKKRVVTALMAVMIMAAAVSGCGSRETNGTETIVSEAEETTAESTEKGTEATEEATEETTEAVTEEATEKSSEVVKSTEKKENVKPSEVAKSTERKEEVKATEAQKPAPAPAPTEKQEEAKPAPAPAPTEKQEEVNPTEAQKPEPAPAPTEEKKECEHDWVWGEVIEEPTCKYEGTGYRTCSICGYVAISAIPATGEHDYVLTNPTECGLREEYRCSVCGLGYFGDWIKEDCDEE